MRRESKIWLGVFLALGSTAAVLGVIAHKAQAKIPDWTPPWSNVGGDLYGKVTDSFGNPLENVMVNMAGWAQYTDANGRYGYQSITPGDYTIAFIKSGYTTLQNIYEIKEGINIISKVLAQ